MIQRILIPLDGSELSESVVLEVRRLLLGLDDVQVTLLGVVEPMTDLVGDSEPPIQLRMESARRHLASVQERLAEDGVQVESKAVMGDPAGEILRAIARTDADLVAMATHGRSGLARWIRGSVAERVLRRSPAPVFLSNPQEAEGQTMGTTIRRILVPLDGSELAAQALPLAEVFAKTYEAEVLLLRVVGLPIAYTADAGIMQPPPSLLTPEEGAKTLRPHESQLADKGLNVRILGTMGEAAAEILRVLEEQDADLLVMTTHGHTGLDRWLFGSVAEKVLRHCPKPLLLKRVAGLSTEESPSPEEGAS